MNLNFTIVLILYFSLLSCAKHKSGFQQQNANSDNANIDVAIRLIEIGFYSNIEDVLQRGYVGLYFTLEDSLLNHLDIDYLIDSHSILKGEIFSKGKSQDLLIRFLDEGASPRRVLSITTSISIMALTYYDVYKETRNLMEDDSTYVELQLKDVSITLKANNETLFKYVLDESEIQLSDSLKTLNIYKF